jgi:hypothetical protein
MDESQVAKFKHPDKMVSGGGRVSVRHRTVGVKEDGEIEEFFGQMWWFLSTPQPRVNQSPITQPNAGSARISGILRPSC